MNDHVVHTFNADDGIHPCVICGRDAIVCPECKRCTVCLHCEPLGAGASTRKDEVGSDEAVPRSVPADTAVTHVDSTPAVTTSPAPNGSHVEIPDILDRVKGVMYGDAPDLEGFDGLTTMWEVRRACESVIAAARAMKREADGWLAEYLGDKATRLDDSFLYAGPKRTMTVYNRTGLFRYLGNDVADCFRPDDLRISSLRAVAKKRLIEQNPDIDDKVLNKSIAAVVNSFVDWDTGESQLHVVPINQAPKYAQQLEQAEITERKTRR